MDHKVNHIIKRIVTDHHTVMFIGVMLMLMGFISLSENLFEKMFGIQFNMAYGFIFLGVFNVLMAIAFIIMGAMNIEAVIQDENKEDPLEAIQKRINDIEAKIESLETELARYGNGKKI